MNANFKNLHFWFLILLLLVAAGFVNWRENTGDAKVARLELRLFPNKIGDWQKLGEDREFSADVVSVLRPDDYLFRNYYQPQTGKSANVYVGFYNTQRTGATYHSPRNCLPGTGWMMGEPDEITIPLSGGQKFAANYYQIENKDGKYLMIYWYQGRGRMTANEYADKILTVWDSASRRRSDGALVRIVASLDNQTEQSQQLATNLAARVAEELTAFVPK